MAVKKTSLKSLKKADELYVVMEVPTLKDRDYIHRDSYTMKLSKWWTGSEECYVFLTREDAEDAIPDVIEEIQNDIEDYDHIPNLVIMRVADEPSGMICKAFDIDGSIM